MANIKFNGADNAFIHADSGTVFAGTANTDPIKPSYGSRLTVTPPVEELKFGDGYSQFTLQNGVRRGGQKYQVVFKKVTASIQAALLNFFDGTGTAPYDREANEYFLWTPPASFAIGTAEGKWIILEPYTSVPISYDAFDVTVVFTKVEE